MPKLYVIASPIGNLEDITARAIKALQEVKVVFCEDTRVTAKLFHVFAIPDKPLISFNKDNEERKSGLIFKEIEQGFDVALISDAGTPLISDPGQGLIREIYEYNETAAEPIELVPIPGACSLTVALSVCPIDTTGFIFEGFLPHGPKQRRRVLRSLAENDSKRPLVFFESPHRLKKSLEDFRKVFLEEAELAGLECFLAKELTKLHEEYFFGAIEEVIAAVETKWPKDKKVQGEFVVVVKAKTLTT